MKTRPSWHLWVVIPLLGVGRGVSAEAMSQEQIRSAAAAFASKVRAGPLCPPSWADATIADCSAVSRAPGEWHICTLARGDAPAGYVLLWEAGGEVLPVAYSGSRWTSLVLEVLSAPEHSALSEPPATIGGPRDVPMVAMVHKEQGTFPLSVGSLACAAASVAGFMQRVRGYPLFDDVGVVNPDTYRCWPAPNALAINVGEVTAESATRIGKATTEQIAAYRNAKDKLLRSRGLITNAYEPRLNAEVPRVGDDDAAFVAARELRRRYLLEPASAEVRQEIMKEEHQAARAALRSVEQSHGMTDAYVLDRGYLAYPEAPEENLRVFFLTRGFDVRFARKPVPSVLVPELPCLLLLAGKEAGVLLGISRTPSTHWALVALPQTVVPVREPVWDTSRRMQAAMSGRDPHAIRPPVSRTSPPATAPAGDDTSGRPRSPYRQMDPLGNAPASLDAGAHWFLIDFIPAASALVASDPKVANNWGGLPVRFNERSTQ